MGFFNIWVVNVKNLVGGMLREFRSVYGRIHIVCLGYVCVFL
mgnify:CR=1 FL=1